jgi:hypothetical protein
MYLYCYYIVRDDEEELEPEAHGPANTSTSHTLVLSEDRRVVPETSPPAQDDLEASTPAPSPWAPKKKRARTGAAGKQELAAGSMSTPLLNGVSYLFLFVAFLFTRTTFCFLVLYFSLVDFLQPLMKEMVDLGSRFIGFRDEAESLKGKILLHWTLYIFISCFVSSIVLFSRSVASCRRKRRRFGGETQS